MDSEPVNLESDSRPVIDEDIPPLDGPPIITTHYMLTGEMAMRIDNTFRYHAPKGDQALRYERIREYAHDFAIVLCGFCPPSRELSLALTKLEELVMQANAAIARNE